MRPLARIPLVATAALMLFTSTASAQIGQRCPGGGDGPTVLDPGTPPCERCHRVRVVHRGQTDRHDGVVRLQQHVG